MAGIVDAVRERLSGQLPSEIIQIERQYVVALLQLIEHTDCHEHNGALEIDPRSYRATYAGKYLGLTKDEFLTLYAIASKADGATYREIYDLCKGKGFVAGDGGHFQGNVRTMIKRLRRKLCMAGLSAQVIVNRPGVGYYWHDLSAERDRVPPLSADEGRSRASDGVIGVSPECGCKAAAPVGMLERGR
jgi:DNA-binding response OmpR family regulator